MARGEGGPLEPGDLGYRVSTGAASSRNSGLTDQGSLTGRLSDPLKSRFTRTSELSRGRGLTAMKRRSLIGRGRQPGSLIGDFDPINLQYLIDQ